MDFEKVIIRIAGLDISQAIRPLVQSFFGNITFEYFYVSEDELRYEDEKPGPGECVVSCLFGKDEAFCRVKAESVNAGGNGDSVYRKEESGCETGDNETGKPELTAETENSVRTEEAGDWGDAVTGKTETENSVQTEEAVGWGDAGQYVLENMLKEMPSDISEYRYAAGRLVYDLLHRLTGRYLPWGVMVGIRPTKHVYEALETGKSEAWIRNRFENELLVSHDRTGLSLDIAKKELSILNRFDYRNGFSIYIGIPFCPTTCLYCSFTSYPASRFGHLMDAYLDALEKELVYASELCGKNIGASGKTGIIYGKKLNTIYVGGGTPTALDEKNLERLMRMIHKYLPVDDTLEFSVEAGRPDSLNEEKLRILKEYGVTRISINPQTLNQKTLDIIGRKHSVEQVYRAFDMARKAGHENINMDLILGLTGENVGDVSLTLEGVRKIMPESLTVHTLAIKRAARLKLENDKYKAMAAEDVAGQSDLAIRFARECGYEPYYLYRQKNMAENLENIGWSLPGYEGLYNILIMEEKQTILALGAGATTKLVFPENENGVRIERIENVKSLTDYISRTDEMVGRKRLWN